MEEYIRAYNDRYNIGLTLEQAARKAGYRLADVHRERGYHTSLWVHRQLVRCFVTKL